MSQKTPRTLVWLVTITILLAGLGVTSGCTGTGGKEPGATNPETQEQAGGTESADQGGESLDGSGAQSAGTPLELGAKGSNGVVSEVAITKVTVVDNLTSPDSVALLQNGAPGESPEVDKKPEAGNELLMVTFAYKATKEKVQIRPADIKLTDGEGTEYNEVSTSGHGGVFNMDPPKIGEEIKVTAVYEVPKDKTGLTLAYQPWGDKELTFKVR